MKLSVHYAPKGFVATMRAQGLTATVALRGLRLLNIQPMATPELLSRPCGICVARKRVDAQPSTWIYRPMIEGDYRVIACAHHTAAAVRVYVASMPAEASKS